MVTDFQMRHSSMFTFEHGFCGCDMLKKFQSRRKDDAPAVAVHLESVSWLGPFLLFGLLKLNCKIISILIVAKIICSYSLTHSVCVLHMELLRCEGFQQRNCAECVCPGVGSH